MTNTNQICPNCSAQLPPNVKFCTKCGTKLEKSTDPTETGQKEGHNVENSTPPPYNRPTNPSPNDPVESLKESGKDLVKDVNNFFNKSTGNRSRHQYCPNCSAPLPANAKFCSKCGYTIEQKNPTLETKQKQVEKNEFDQLQYLEKLAELRDKGIISDEEFEKKKKDILKL